VWFGFDLHGRVNVTARPAGKLLIIRKPAGLPRSHVAVISRPTFITPFSYIEGTD
jgi:hypothetical protein